MNDYILVDAQFFFAPLDDTEPLGKAISISFLDKYPTFNHKKEILENFESKGLILLDYQITYRPVTANDDVNFYNPTKH
tara:strand:- start:22 stop:258 length:237 start_codon:yes stop_codon:yes gene_type:complete